MKPFYQVMQNEKSADVYIFGDICGWAFEELGEQSAVTLTDKIKNLDVEYKELKEKKENKLNEQISDKKECYDKVSKELKGE